MAPRIGADRRGEVRVGALHAAACVQQPLLLEVQFMCELLILRRGRGRCFVRTAPLMAVAYFLAPAEDLSHELVALGSAMLVYTRVGLARDVLVGVEGGAGLAIALHGVHAAGHRADEPVDRSP